MKNKAFSSVFVLTCSGMLTALSIVIGILCKSYLNFGHGLFRVTFENFPIILSGLLFGPWVGACVGAASDVLSYVLSTQSLAISPIVTLGAASVGLVSGLVSRYLIRNSGSKQILCATYLAHLVGSLLIKCAGLYVYYGAAVLWRIPVYAVIAFLESVILILLYRNKTIQKTVWNQKNL